MDYRIDFSAAKDTGALALPDVMATQSSEITRNANEFHLSAGGTLNLAADEGVNVVEATNAGLFDVLVGYFRVVERAEYGALVTLAQDGVLTMIAVSDDDTSVREQFELGFVAPASELLSNREAFLSAWPALLQTHMEAQDEAVADAERVTSATADASFVFEGLLPDQDADAGLTSFMLFRTTAERVMEDLVGAKTYVREDSSFLRLDLDHWEGAIEVVGFDTSSGFGLELRLPLEQDRIREAIRRLAVRAAELNIELYYVTEIVDEEETFILQRTERDGFFAGTRADSVAMSMGLSWAREGRSVTQFGPTYQEKLGLTRHKPASPLYCPDHSDRCNSCHISCHAGSTHDFDKHVGLFRDGAAKAFVDT